MKWLDNRFFTAISHNSHIFIMDKAVRAFPKMFPFPELVSGCGSSSKLPEILKKHGITKVLIVTGPHIGKSLVPPLVDKIQSEGIQCEVFAKTEANPSIETVLEIAALYRRSESNGFLAIGGGSPMDAAKVAAVHIAKPNQDIRKMAGVMKVHHSIAPIICVPTTAGTGSEASIGAVITDRRTEHKYAISDPVLTPKAAVLDPELTVSMSPFVTATTGMDALTHAVESYITRAYNTDFTNRCCEESIVDIFKYLEKAYADGEDLDAREKMLNASYKAGLAFTRSGLGYVHGIAHCLGGLYRTPHGLANAVLLPVVLESYGPCIYAKLGRLAELTGILDRDSSVTKSSTVAEKADAFIKEICRMNARMGLPEGFDFIEKSDYPTIARRALHEANSSYPVPVILETKDIYSILDRVQL